MNKDLIRSQIRAAKALLGDEEKIYSCTKGIWPSGTDGRLYDGRQDLDVSLTP